MKKRQQTNQRGRKITNWRSYNDALVGRGSLTIWIEEHVIDNWFCRRACRGQGCPVLLDILDNNGFYWLAVVLQLLISYHAHPDGQNCLIELITELWHGYYY